MQEMQSMQEACCTPPARNQPRIAAVIEEETTQFFIMCEQKIVCKVDCLQNALFLVFSAYYVFNLEYPNNAKSILYFIQDYILSSPDTGKRLGSYLAVVSDIQRCVS